MTPAPASRRGAAPSGLASGKPKAPERGEKTAHPAHRGRAEGRNTSGKTAHPAHRGRAEGPERRAQRLLRWYPADWRARYGPEFAELLIADLAERPRCWRRDADVARGGLRARLATAGLASHPAGPAAAGRAALATLACSVAGFLICGATVWAQLTVGWQWAPPADRVTAVAMVVLSVAMPLFAVLAALSAVTVGWAAVRAWRQGDAARLRWPALLIAGPAAVLLIGGRHFQNGWPGTGAHWWPHQGLVPGGVAAFAWACTLPVTSYWAHPAALATFPLAELGWLITAPAAVGCLLTGVRRLVRRLDLPPGVVRFQAWLGAVTAAGMAAVLAGVLCWAAEGGPGPQGLFRAGAIDGGAAAVMALSMITGWLALRQLLAWRHPAAPAPVNPGRP